MHNNVNRAYHIVVQDHATNEIYREFCYLYPEPYRDGGIFKPFNFEAEMGMMGFVATFCPEYLNGYHGFPDCNNSEILALVPCPAWTEKG